MCLFGESSYFRLTESLECPKGDNYICKNSHRCISKDYLCDGMNDCWNTFSGADEYFCCKYNCKNSNICISKNNIFDGMNDCWNTFSGADEYFCCK